MFSDEAAEIRLLAACLDKPELVQQLKPVLFTGERITHFNGMLKCYTTYGLISHEGFHQSAGMVLPNDYEAARGTVQSVVPLLDRLAVYARRRELVKVQDRINTLILREDLDETTIAREIAIPPITVQSDTNLAAGAAEFSVDFLRKRSGEYVFVDTGLTFLNYMLGGEWPRQGLTIILGEGGAGKTTLVGCSALNMARNNGMASLMISLEMPKSRLVSRYVANVASIDNILLRSGKVEEEDIPKVDAALEYVTSLPLYIDDRVGIGIGEIVEQIRIHKERYGIEAVFIDYLQIIDSGKAHENTSDLYAYFAQQIRNAAVRYDVAAVMLAQQNRSLQGLHSILGSGRVGHIADVVMELKKAEGSAGDARLIELDVHKNRDGPLGSQTAVYEGKYLRFIS